MVIFTTLPPGTSNDDGRILVDESDYQGVDDEQLPFEIKDVVRIRANEKFSKCYDCMDEIGEGKFGKVYRCREKATGLELAAKRIKIKRDADREKVEREVAIMTRLRHPRIAQIYDAFATPDNDVVLVMEIVNGGELFDRVVDENYILTELAVVMIVRQLCEAISYIHSKNVVHLDIKPENIMCVSQTGNRIKLIDFGLAQFYDGSSNLLFMAGTPEFVAPEVIKFEPIDFYTDMWSIGVITYILLSGISPFLGETLGDTYVAVEKGEWEFDDEAFEGISDAAKDFISKLLVMDQKQRMLPEDCLHHPWIVDSRTKAVNDLMLNQVNNGTLLSKEGLKYYLRNKRFRKATWALVFLIRFKRRTLMNFGKRKIPNEFIMAKIYNSLPIPIKEITGSCVESESSANVTAKFTLDGQKTEKMLPNISNVAGQVFDTTRTELVAAARHLEEKKLSSEIPKKKPKSSANDERKKLRSSDEENTKKEGKKHREKNSEKSDEMSCKPKKVSKHLKPLSDHLESQIRTSKAVVEHHEVADSKKLPAEMCEVCITLEIAKPVVSCTEISKPVYAAESVHLRSMTSELARTNKDEAEKEARLKKSCALLSSRTQESVRHSSSVNKLSEINKKGSSVAAILSMFTEKAEQERKCFEHRSSRPVRTFRDVDKSSSRKSSLVLNHENEANCVKLYRAPEEEKKRVKNLIELHRRGSADRKQVDTQEIVAVKQEEKSTKGFPAQSVNSTNENKAEMKKRSNGKKTGANPVLNVTERWENKVKVSGIACPELNTNKNTPVTEERSNNATTMTKTGDMKDERKILQEGVVEFKVDRKVMGGNVTPPKSVVVVETLQIETLLTSRKKTTVQNDSVVRSKGTRRGSQNDSSLNPLSLEEPKHPEINSGKITSKTDGKKSTSSSESRASGKRHSAKKETTGSAGSQDVLNRRRDKIGSDIKNPSIRDGKQKLVLPEKFTGHEDLPSGSAKKMKEKVDKMPLDTSHFPCKARETKLIEKKGQIQKPISVLQSLSVDQVSTTKHTGCTYESQQCSTPRKPPKAAGLSGRKKSINENKRKELEYESGADTISSVVSFEKAVASVHNKVSKSLSKALYCIEDTMICDRDSMEVCPSPRSAMQDTMKRKVSQKSSCSKNLLIRMRSEINLADGAKKTLSNPTDTVRRKAVDDQAVFSNQTGQSQRSISIASLKNQENFSFGWLKLQLETRVNKEKEDQMAWRYRRDLEISPIQSGNAKKALNIWRAMEQSCTTRI